MNKDYTIGIYIRLSMADEDTGNGSKAESDSIGNQRMLINRYLDNHPTLSKYPRLEFADDGYTGTNFHRPQFSAMMEKVRHGEINLICVKDFSRFSRVCENPHSGSLSFSGGCPVSVRSALIRSAGPRLSSAVPEAPPDWRDPGEHPAPVPE